MSYFDLDRASWQARSNLRGTDCVNLISFYSLCCVFQVILQKFGRHMIRLLGWVWRKEGGEFLNYGGNYILVDWDQKLDGQLMDW